MKLVMENWNSFLKENKKQEIIDLKFGEITSKKHKKRLAEQPEIIDIKLSDIPITKYPANDSSAVKVELGKVLHRMTNNEEISKEELEKLDQKPKTVFTDYLKENDLDYDDDFLEDLFKDVSRISLKLKVRYNRPRPEQLGPKLGYGVKSIKTDTDSTPSYPSGHTIQAWTIGHYLASKHPDHRKDILNIAQKIEDSRIIRGAHFPSDNREAKSVAEKYLFPNIKEPK
tara:strand:- start:28 stop:711 length:684 start_codon:yes stop_codon:yes gene_type:complete